MKKETATVFSDESVGETLKNEMVEGCSILTVFSYL